MENDTKGIRWQSEHRRKVENLIHLVNKARLADAHRQQNRRKASGIDGVTKDEYGQELDQQLDDLVVRMKQFSYRPQSVRRTYIPKGNGAVRPLGIPAYEDRLVQGVMADILNDVYEPRFLDCSYGFRQGRSAHQAVRVINQTIMTGKVNYVVEADIKGFFDNVNHNWLMRFLENDIADQGFLRYVKRFLKAGVMEDGKQLTSEKGTPQGGLISPILANVFLHYILDWWFETCIKPMLKGEAYYIRYADDYLMMFQYEEEAQLVMAKMIRRLNHFELEVAEDKTRILPMGRFKGTKESFDFLGFTFFNTKTRGGKYRLGVRTSNKKLKVKRQAVKAWLKTRTVKPVIETMQRVALILRGHGNYYGVSGNFTCLQKFWWYVQFATYRMLNRRDQKGRLKFEKFQLIWREYVPEPKLTVDIWEWQPKTI